MKVIEQFDPTLPLLDIFPKSWTDLMGSFDNLMFRNLDHFRYVCSNIKSRRDDNCGVTYAKALEMLTKGITDFPESEQDSIRNLVRSNLKKRGLITEEVYENFRYTSDGTKVDVDVGKFNSGEPDCVLTPSVQYVDFFYELYISISYRYGITNETIRENVAKLLATIEELERQHIYIKIVMIFPARNVTREYNKNFFSTVPLFSHKEYKNVSLMSSVVNDRLLRKFYFAILENVYGTGLSDSYGQVIQLPECMNIGTQFQEIEFFESVVTAVGA